MILFHFLTSIDRGMDKQAGAVREYNFSRLRQTLLIAIFLLFCVTVIGLFSRSIRLSALGYVSALIFFFLLYEIFSREGMKRHVLTGWYSMGAVIFGLSFYLSLFRFPQRPAATMMTMLCIFPLVFMGRPGRFIPFLTGIYLVHSGLSFAVKGEELGVIDLVNGLVSTALGLMVGSSLMQMRLESFAVQKELIWEKTTDVLTEIWNRRKLFETIDRLNRQKDPRPSGVFMIDIDYFKEFNDTYGHAAGDECLRAMGHLFREFAETHRTVFYRYGGEEFVVFLYDCSYEEVGQEAQLLRMSAAKMSVHGRKVTVSIGTVYCNDPAVTDYEEWISRADHAAYTAKKNSRNTVVCWNELTPPAEHRGE